MQRPSRRKSRVHFFTASIPITNWFIDVTEGEEWASRMIEMMRSVYDDQSISAPENRKETSRIALAKGIGQLEMNVALDRNPAM
jgi:hypothetical protein